ncbi:MAG: alpha/beta fold hydrolase [Candidatus Omnitrophica bacterium]|nr:alpha/beta fold hydrolase [Candidatus Omnitrophota bacterium]
MKKDYIGYRKWSAPDPRCAFLLVHGLGTYSGRWESMAGFFLQKGISSYAIDLPELDCIRSYYNEILRVREAAIKDNPGKKVFLVGESLGGLTSFLFTAEHPGLFEGLVCISPAFANRKTLKFFETVKMLLPILYNPAKQVNLSFDSSMCTRDTDCRKKIDSDPREYRSASVGLIFDILITQTRTKRAIKNMNTPVLFMVSEEDLIIDTETSRKVFDSLTAKDKTFIGFPGMYHALSIELGKEAVFEELFKWIEKRL